MPGSETPGALPAVFTGRRRRRLALLAGAGLVQAAASVATAVLTSSLLSGGGPLGPLGLSLSLIGVALAIGAVRIAERVLAEDLAQDYVADVRRLVVASALSPARSANLGITVARTTNDLTALRNWVALGIAPLLVGVPMIVGVVVALLVISPPIAFVVVAALAGFAALMLTLAGPAYRRARELRRVRGRMAAHIADTVIAGGAIRVAGGVRRELKHVDRLSGHVADAAHARAIVSGALRGGAASVTAVLAVLVAVVGVWLGASGADITAGVLVAGLLTAPVTDLGRVNEYRQSMRAAQTVLGPVLARARAFTAADAPGREADGLRIRRGASRLGRGVVHVADLRDDGGHMPELVAAPGARVVLTGTPVRVERVLDLLAGDRPGDEGWVRVEGDRLADLDSADRRARVGVAAHDWALARGTIARIARYRTPGSGQTVHELLERVGLADTVAALPDGERTKLRRGGEPLSTVERARLKLAAAVAGDPPLLVVDRLDAQLDRDGVAMLRDVLGAYPGCVIVRSNDAARILDAPVEWNVDETGRGVVYALPARVAAAPGRRDAGHRSEALPPAARAGYASASPRAAIAASSSSSDTSSRRLGCRLE